MGRKDIGLIAIGLFYSLVNSSPVLSQDLLVNDYGFNLICQEGYDYANKHPFKAVFSETEEKSRIREKFKKELKRIGITHGGSSKNPFLASSTVYLKEDQDNYAITISIADILRFKCQNADNFISKVENMDYGCDKFYNIKVCKEKSQDNIYASILNN
ncbi:hypothetical protein C0585_04240 [Candidatus Woesearchaeota archaeon]|nr:MAG: hypothetical protein C0585_04240 [Candidatus Woesearchaeota archaeon]